MNGPTVNGKEAQAARTVVLDRLAALDTEEFGAALRAALYEHPQVAEAIAVPALARAAARRARAVTEAAVHETTGGDIP